MKTQEDRHEDRHDQQQDGLVNGMLAVVRDFTALLFNRIELAALEFSEVRSALLGLLQIGIFALVAIWLALAYWSAIVVYLAWDALGWKILPIVALAFSLLAWILLRHMRSRVKRGCLSMPATVAELRSDRDAFR